MKFIAIVAILIATQTPAETIDLTAVQLPIVFSPLTAPDGKLEIFDYAMYVPEGTFPETTELMELCVVHLHSRELHPDEVIPRTDTQEQFILMDHKLISPEEVIAIALKECGRQKNILDR